MEDVPEKLTTGVPLTIEELLVCFPALGEKDEKGKDVIAAALLKNYALGAAVWQRYRRGDIICREGDFGSTAFYIQSGHVEVYIENPLAKVKTQKRFWGLFSKMRSKLVRDKKSEGSFIGIDAAVDLPKLHPLATMGPGDLFGEMTCRTFQPRSATVRATEDCVVVEFLRVILDMLVGTRTPSTLTVQTTKVRMPTFKGTSFKKDLDQRYRERSLETHLRGVPLFAGIHDDFIEHLTKNAELVSYNQGDVIFRQGDTADALYLVRMGLVKVSQSMPGGEMVRTYLSRGQFFGEIGLLRGGQRTATCTALDVVDLVRIHEADFWLMMEQFPGVKDEFCAIADKTLAANARTALPTGLQMEEYLNQGLFEAQNLLLIDLDSCTRCDACVNACADAHDGVTRLIRDGLRYDKYLVPTACRSCRDPLCMTQCPVGSIRRKESLEIIIEDWCIGCSKCAELCPYGNINMHPFEVVKEVPAPAPEAKKTVPPVAAASAAKPLPAAPRVVPAKSSASPAETSALPTTPSSIPVELSASPVEVSASPAELSTTPATPNSSPETPTLLPKPISTLPATSPTHPAESKTIPAEVRTSPAEVKPLLTASETIPTPVKTTPIAPQSTATPVKTVPAPSKTPPAPAKPQKMVKKITITNKATTCDLCTDLSTPSCVYACPHDAAKRVDPTEFLARQIGLSDEKKSFFGRRSQRVTHHGD